MRFDCCYPTAERRRKHPTKTFWRQRHVTRREMLEVHGVSVAKYVSFQCMIAVLTRKKWRNSVAAIVTGISSTSEKYKLKLYRNSSVLFHFRGLNEVLIIPFLSLLSLSNDVTLIDSRLATDWDDFCLQCGGNEVISLDLFLLLPFYSNDAFFWLFFISLINFDIFLCVETFLMNESKACPPPSPPVTQTAAAAIQHTKSKSRWTTSHAELEPIWQSTDPAFSLYSISLSFSNNSLTIFLLSASTSLYGLLSIDCSNSTRRS